MKRLLYAALGILFMTGCGNEDIEKRLAALEEKHEPPKKEYVRILKEDFYKVLKSTGEVDRHTIWFNSSILDDYEIEYADLYQDGVINDVVSYRIIKE